MSKIPVYGGKDPHPDEKCDWNGHRGDYAPQVGRDDPGEGGKGPREKGSRKGRLNKEDDEQFHLA